MFIIDEHEKKAIIPSSQDHVEFYIAKSGDKYSVVMREGRLDSLKQTIIQTFETQKAAEYAWLYIVSDLSEKGIHRLSRVEDMEEHVKSL